MLRAPFMLLVVLALACPAQAAFYKWRDADGVVHYSDRPAEGAEEVDLPEPSRYSPPPLPGRGEDRSDGQAAGEGQAADYTDFRIVQPPAGGYVRNATGNVPVVMQLAPPLQEGHRINLRLDGVGARTQVSSTRATLQGIDRGTHTLQAEVVDESGNPLIRSEPVQFFYFLETVDEPGIDEPPEGEPYREIPENPDQYLNPPTEEPPFAPGDETPPDQPGGAFSPAQPGGGSVYQPSYQPSFQPSN